MSQLEVVGGQIIGDKAAQLIEHEALIYEVGLSIPPTTIIASETVRAEGFVWPEANESTKAALLTALGRHAAAPALVVRSSAEGDASGNGVYESRFAASIAEFVLKEAAVVIESFQSTSAADFRRQVGLGDSFALMIQPVVGQELIGSDYWERFGPYLSGFGYSSSLLNPEGYINVVAGIGGGVSRRGGQIVSAEELATIAGKTIRTQRRQIEGKALSFHDFLYAIHEAVSLGNMPDIRNDFRSGGSMHCQELVMGDYALAHYLVRKAGTEEFRYQESGTLEATTIQDSYDSNHDWQKSESVESQFLKSTKSFKPHILLQTMQRMEQIAGYPLYIEWALGSERKALQPVILQIAPAEQTARAKLETSLEGEVIGEAKHILGHGIKESHKIVAVASPIDIEHLREFNKGPENEGYVLVFGSVLTGPYSNTRLLYSDCSKAGVLLEIQAQEMHYRHANGDVVQHLFGASRETDKFVGEIPNSPIDEVLPIWQRIFSEGRHWNAESSKVSSRAEHGSIYYLEGDFKILADATTGTFVITESRK